ncbi:MAG: hypothetical protein R2684_14125 [Pyrinomonadaceae bacterium]
MNYLDESLSRREYLLLGVKKFVEEASKLEGVRRIALVGSLTTYKSEPKDADVLVTVDDDVDMKTLATLGRRLKNCLPISSGADIFLSNERNEYLGRTCRFRECSDHHRCEGFLCYQGKANWIQDDFQNVKLPEKLIVDPPVVLWPEKSGNAPDDVVRILF